MRVPSGTPFFGGWQRALLLPGKGIARERLCDKLTWACLGAR
jgi:hypothetical protein